ncbi:MAG TPA: diaminobutyrate--2-oxoglutarate transaminase [Gammaproteobacteria bacterium]|jgi:diaminobutyrate-2-oxoglutarate transaminase
MSTPVKFLDVKTKAGSTFERMESGVRSYCRSVPVVFSKASGVELFDAEGTPYLDFLCGAGSLNYGHNHPILRRALVEYIAEAGVTHSLDFHSVAKERFLAQFEHLILKPRKLDYAVQFTGPTGTNAVEAALKLARKVTGRESVVSFTNAFHGVSLGALAVTGNEYHRAVAGVSMPGSLRAPFDGYMGADIDTLDYLEKALDDSSSGFGHPAAIIIETVQGEGGLNVASPEWLRRLAALCKQRAILLIIDDIQAGCGRTGEFFSFESAGIVPDMVTLSKSLSGYGLPFAVLLLERGLDHWQPGEHNGTFRGNNHAFVTATVALETFWSTPSFAHDVRRKASLLKARLTKTAERWNGRLKTKGRGLMVGLECDSGQTAAAICAAAFKRKLIMETSGADGEVAKCLPALTITDAELERGMSLFTESVAEVMQQ